MVKGNTRADRISTAFREGNVSVSDFCDATGISPQAVSKAKRTGSMSIDNLIVLARMSDYDIEWIATGTSDKQRQTGVPSKTIVLSSRIHALPKQQQALIESILENLEIASRLTRYKNIANPGANYYTKHDAAGIPQAIHEQDKDAKYSK